MDKLFFTENYSNRGRKVDTSGNITAGIGTAGYNGDNIPATTAQYIRRPCL